MSDIAVIVQTSGWDIVPDMEQLVCRAAEAALATDPRRAGASLAVALADDSAVAELNGRYRGKAEPTNVLAFPAGGIGAAGLGDLILAWETCVREAASEGKPIADHLAHLVVHGTLHLMGHDHDDDDAADRMERLETQVLAGLGIPDPYRAVVAPAVEGSALTTAKIAPTGTGERAP